MLRKLRRRRPLKLSMETLPTRRSRMISTLMFSSETSRRTKMSLLTPRKRPRLTLDTRIQ
jgi:hypothetical protein